MKFINRKGESLYLPDDTAIQKARSEGYRKGWDDRGILDESIVQDALRDSRNYHDFLRTLKDKFSEAEWTRLL